MSIKIDNNKHEIKQDRLAPDKGGFRYIIFIAVTVIAVTVSLPLGVFGIVFGKFLSSIGDETAGTSLANGMFNTVLSFTGLAANVLLNRWSCRAVGLLGALFTIAGTFSLVFIHDLMWFIVLFGVFQGFGYGLLFPASLTALNDAFDEKSLSFMMSVSQALMVAFCMFMPPAASAVMAKWGYSCAIFCLGGVTLLNFPAAVALSRFKNNNNRKKKNQTKPNKYQEEPLLNKQGSLGALPSPLRILRIADRAASLASINRDIAEVKGLVWNPVDCSLLASPKYLNISVGLALSFTSDVCFITLLPIILSDLGFESSEIALTMSIFFGSDLASRILLSIVSGMTTIRSRHLVLASSFLSALFRLAFVWCNSYKGKIVTLAALGFLRCFIQTPVPLVISEEYPDRFATAYSLYMVVCGVVTLIFGPLMGVLKSLTGSNEMVCHLLTSCYVICVIAWLSEMAFDLRRERLTSEKPAPEV